MYFPVVCSQGYIIDTQYLTYEAGSSGGVQKRAFGTCQKPLRADEARFELAEGVALTRFRGVLLRPLGHSSVLQFKQLVYYATCYAHVNL